jgi:hypothetical protein
MTNNQQQENQQFQRGFASLIAASDFLEVEDAVPPKNMLVKDSVWEASTLVDEANTPFNAFKAIKSAFKIAVLYGLSTIVVYSGGTKGLQVNCSEDRKQSRGKCKCSLHIIAKRVRMNSFT